MIAFALALWLWAAPGLAQGTEEATTSLSGALSAASRQVHDRALLEERRGDLRRAEAAWTLLTSREPGYAPGWLGLGRVRLGLGKEDGAREAYARVPFEPDAVRALAGLVAEDDPAEAARWLARLTTLDPGDRHAWLELAAARARAGQLDEARAALDHWLGLEEGPPDGAVVLTVARALEADGQQAAAVAVLESFLDRGGEGDAAAEARGRLDRVAVERSARTLGIGGAAPLVGAPRQRLDAARADLAAGRLDAARPVLQQLVTAHPRSAAVRGALGDLYRLEGTLGPAEQSYTWATALDPTDPEWHLRLGLLLAEAYGGRRHAEARDALARARALQPERAGIAFSMGRVLQESGAVDEAVEALRAGLALRPTGPDADAARVRLAALLRQPPPSVPLPVPSSPPPDVPEDALLRYRVAMVYLERGLLDQARAELLPALKLAPDWPALHNLSAALQLQAGDSDGAAEAWRRSLALSPQQPRVHLALAEVALNSGDRDAARRRFSTALEAGASGAAFRLASFAWEEGDVYGARALLDQYFAGSTGGLDDEPARALARAVDRRIALQEWGAMGGGAALLLVVVAALARRRRGRTLEQLIAQVPEAAHDAARILSALRHEVVKHNTTLLDDVARALEQEDHHAVAFAATRLFGAEGEGGVLRRFEDDLDALTRLARRHGVTLDLHRKDPVLAPMLRAVRRLQRLEPQLRRPWRARRGTPGELREISHALNREGYPALGRLLAQMGTTLVTRGLLQRVDTRVRNEASFQGQQTPPAALFVHEDGLLAKIFAGDLEDVLANLLRNARGALAAVPEPLLAVVVELEEDPITGLEHVSLRVLDNAPGRLTTADIHGRALGRGLGLTADLVARHEGSISVERTPDEADEGYCKAVVVRLLRAESPSGAPAEAPPAPAPVRVLVEPDPPELP